MINPKALIAAKVYLEMRGYTIREQEWRRPKFVIDIVAEKQGVVHFVDVEYSAREGRAVEVSTSRLHRLRSAAELWVEENEYSGRWALSSIEVNGPNYVILGFSEGSL